MTEEELPEPELAYTTPKLQQRSVVATSKEVQAFGEMLAQAAWTRGFYGAHRRAFVADGSNSNWGVWERHFSNFVAITDFIHALSYVFHGAMAGRSFADGWAAYSEWISHVWAGQIEPEFSQLYTFYVTADDGARLWVNDQLVVTRTFYATPTANVARG